MSKSVFIHIGLPRTATTFFQQNIFSQLKEFEFFGVETANYNEHFNKLQFADDSLYDQIGIDQIKEKWVKDKIILSNENFSGQSLYLNHVNRSLIAHRLKAAFPDAKILIVLRNQIELLTSLYSLVVLWKETRKIDDYIWEPFKNSIYEEGPMSTYFNTVDGYECLDGYDYLPFIELYKSLFKDVKVLLFEDLIHDSQYFSGEVESFFNLEKDLVFKAISDRDKMNEGVSALQAKRLRVLNLFYDLSNESILFKKIYWGLKKQILKTGKESGKVEFSESKKNHLMQYFGELNQKLNEKYPELRINKYGEQYYLNNNE